MHVLWLTVPDEILVLNAGRRDNEIMIQPDAESVASMLLALHSVFSWEMGVFIIK